MANWCSLNIDVICGSAADADLLCAYLATAQNNAQERNVDFIHLCSATKYLFWPLVEVADRNVVIYGSVRWGLTARDVSSLLHRLKSTAQIEKLDIVYDECGCRSFGRYTYKDGAMTDRYLPVDHFPEWPEEGVPDDYNDMLLKALEEHGISQDIPVYPPAEDDTITLNADGQTGDTACSGQIISESSQKDEK